MARRILFAARDDAALPRGYHPGLLLAHDRKPFPASPERHRGAGRRCARPQFPHHDGRGRHPRLQPRRASRRAATRSRCLPGLASRADGAHAFYLGAELMKAEIAWRLGKRYVQDEPLDWGVAAARRKTTAPG